MRREAWCRDGVNNNTKSGSVRNTLKVYLNHQVKYHKIYLDAENDSLTKSKASGKMDTIILEYRRIRR